MHIFLAYLCDSCNFQTWFWVRPLCFLAPQLLVLGPGTVQVQGTSFPQCPWDYLGPWECICRNCNGVRRIDICICIPFTSHSPIPQSFLPLLGHILTQISPPLSLLSLLHIFLHLHTLLPHLVTYTLMYTHTHTYTHTHALNTLPPP